MTVDQIVELSKNLTVVVALVIALYGGYKEWWVFGFLYRTMRDEKDGEIARIRQEKDTEIARLRDERDEWRDLAIDATKLGRSAIARTNRVVDKVGQQIATPPDAGTPPAGRKRERTP